MNTSTRLEHDLLGEKAVPHDAYYGVQTARALENFHISGVELRLYPDLIKAFAMVKLAADCALWVCKVRANLTTGVGPASQPKRQPVIAYALLKPLMMTVRSFMPGSAAKL